MRCTKEFLALSSFLLACVVAVAYGLASTEPPSVNALCYQATPATPVAAGRPTPFIGSSEGYRYAAPRGDDNAVRAATDVFVGRVVERREGDPTEEPTPRQPDIPRRVPTTLYVVEVLDTIKGSACGTVLVRQSGIFDDEYLGHGDGAPLLEPDEIAMFTTWWDADAGWYDLFDGRFGHNRVATDEERAATIARYQYYLGTPAAGSRSP
jgi:hypothetical protein